MKILNLEVRARDDETVITLVYYCGGGKYHRVAITGEEKEDVVAMVNSSISAVATNTQEFVDRVRVLCELIFKEHGE